MKLKLLIASFLFFVFSSSFFGQNEFPTVTKSNVKIDGGNLLIQAPAPPVPQLGPHNYESGIKFLKPNGTFNGGLYYFNGSEVYENTLFLGLGDLMNNDGLSFKNGRINVGVGKNNYGIWTQTGLPLGKFNVNGNSYFKGNINIDGSIVIDNKATKHTTIRIGHEFNDAIIADNGTGTYSNGYFFRVHDETVAHKYRNVMTLAENANVGIGTITPKNKLSVNGTIWAKEVKVSLADAADWVFEEDYKLRTLAEVEQYIKENKHLPEVPSAEEFRKNDLKVSEMTNTLLQKIEELTLYTIEQDKEIKAQKDKLEELEGNHTELEIVKKRLAKLEVLLNK